MFNKAQLVERGKHYFDDPKINKMYATTDGNFFYEQDKNYADSHAKGLKTQVVDITRGDLKEKPKAAPEVETPVETEVNLEISSNDVEKSEEVSIDELRAQAKKLKIKGFGVMKEETLIKKIAEANGAE